MTTIGAKRSTGPSPRATNKQHSLASPIPLAVGAVCFLLSLVLAGWTASTAHLTPVLGEYQLPAAAANSWPLSVAGYVLAPISVILTLGWDRVAQRRGLQDRNFALRPRYSFYLRVLAIAGFVVALWHIFNIAVAIASGGPGSS
jgi:hypothetical protein